jgi:hypothetical protein
MNGRCVGDTYEWRNHFTRDVRQLDCAALGMECIAGTMQLSEQETNGCIGTPCTSQDTRCEGAVALNCDGDPWRLSCDGTVLVICNEDGKESIIDCARCNPSAFCVDDVFGGEAVCNYAMFPCPAG